MNNNNNDSSGVTRLGGVSMEYQYNGKSVQQYKYDVLLQDAKNNPLIDYVVKRKKGVRNLVVTYRKKED